MRVALLVAVAAAIAVTTARSCTRKVLITMSSASELPITMPNGTTGYVPIGFYFDELMIPLMALLEEGWTPTFANPQGNRWVVCFAVLLSCGSVASSCVSGELCAYFGPPGHPWTSEAMRLSTSIR